MQIGSMGPFQSRMSGTQARSAPEKLLYSDIDDTFTTKELNAENHERMRQCMAEAPELAFGLSTARRMEDVKKLADRLKGFPLCFLGASNGAELYINEKNLPADEWLMSLTKDDQDPTYRAEVAGKLPGWEPVTAVPAALQQWGFEEVPGKPGGREFRNGDAVVLIFPGNSAFSLKGGEAGLGVKISQALQSSYAKLGIATEDEVNKTKSGYEIHQVLPREVNKASLLEHLVARIPSLTTVITAGDGPADKQLLPDQVAGRPNLRIVAGDGLELKERLGGQEQVAWVASGDLAPALNRYLNS
ncbi:MAG: hypothetical protein KF760_08740 [Candidatus Eremiobacteraeota bacterium]|nr:hypothetical protein [Candidatus Eremiobacteraeota bacterium]MCW5870687.1 hypothetical protein [Candidatus Eremiobacteraeota bacterium]